MVAYCARLDSLKFVISSKGDKMLETKIDVKKTAVLIIDVQNDLIAFFGVNRPGFRSKPAGLSE